MHAASQLQNSQHKGYKYHTDYTVPGGLPINVDDAPAPDDDDDDDDDDDVMAVD